MALLADALRLSRPTTGKMDWWMRFAYPPWDYDSRVGLLPEQIYPEGVAGKSIVQIYGQRGPLIFKSQSPRDNQSAMSEGHGALVMSTVFKQKKSIFRRLGRVRSDMLGFGCALPNLRKPTV